jgi:S-adenosylmethionine:tRNA ribosyltransferase-isomerase
MNQPDLDQLSSWQFELPPELIASRPAERRDASRLLVVDRRQQTITHSAIRDLPQWRRANDLLVFNNTKVLPARLFGTRTATGGKWEGLYVEEISPGVWHLLCETRGRLQSGETITITPAYQEDRDATTALPQSGSFLLKLTEKQSDGGWHAKPLDQRSSLELLEQFGSLPLPPYMGRKLADENDKARYQTAFASQPGAVAAPTAGLHFTPELLQACCDQGVTTAELTLHVGIGTFRPVTAERLSEHSMHEEWCRLPQSACSSLQTARDNGGRIVAVGTTSVRTLESAAMIQGQPFLPWEGRTNLFIQPSFEFQALDCLLTNFHLPGSTLIVLVAALAGYELILEAYRQAIEQRYRFYSYGDAMLIL